MNKEKIANEYVKAIKNQSDLEDELNKTIQKLGTENCIFSLSESLREAYSWTIKNILGDDLYDWVEWWMYEAEFGTRPMKFFIPDKLGKKIEYNPMDMTFEEFFRIVNA